MRGGGLRERDRAAPADGWWWVRPLAPTPDNLAREWRAARVLGGAVQPHGTTAWYAPTAPGLRDAEWVRIDPPGPGTTAVRPETAGRRDRGPGSAAPGRGPAPSGRVQRVAEGIVGAFLAVHPWAATYYARRPGGREELVGQVARLIESVRG